MNKMIIEDDDGSVLLIRYQAIEQATSNLTIDGFQKYLLIKSGSLVVEATDIDLPETFSFYNNYPDPELILRNHVNIELAKPGRHGGLHATAALLKKVIGHTTDNHQVVLQKEATNYKLLVVFDATGNVVEFNSALVTPVTDTAGRVLFVRLIGSDVTICFGCNLDGEVVITEG